MTEKTVETRNRENLSSPEMFIKFYYPEVKDLSKSFLTLVSGILAFSVTFSSTIIGFPNASILQLTFLISSWLFLIVAIVAAGGGIYTNFVSSNIANRAIMEGKEHKIEFSSLVKHPYALLNVAGIAFVIGLILLALAGVSKFL